MRTRELESSPALPPLYAKAALGLIPGGGDELPDEALELAEATVDAEALADYARVCGFALRDTLPPTYPHVLAFPVSMCLMADRSFPFALLGLVHIANRIEQRRPVPVDARPSIRVWAENLRPHHRGRQVDVVAELSLGGEAVWRGQSTYLRPGQGSGARSGRLGGAGRHRAPLCRRLRRPQPDPSPPTERAAVRLSDRDRARDVDLRPRARLP